MTIVTRTVAPASAERVQALVEEVLIGSSHYLVDLAVRGAPGSQVVDIFVDSDEALGVDTLAQISRDVAFLLDTEEVLAGRYRLNVSSPGIERPLKFPRQYKKNVGRVLRVHYRKPAGDGYTEVLGTLTAADDDTIVVTVDGGERRDIRYTNILWAKVQLPW